MERFNTAEYRNNTHENPLEWGIFKFAKDFFPETFSSPFAPLHGEVAEIWAELYSPKRTNRVERQAYVIVFRESAKTTISTFLIPIYCIMMKGKTIAFRDMDGNVFKHKMDEKLIMIASETSGMAETFVMNLREVIAGHRDLARLFGNKHPKAVQLDDDPDIVGENRIWRQNAFTTSDDTTVWGVGAGQQVRGKQVKRFRPTLALGDDIYSENNIKTQERRAGINRWWFASYSNSLDSKNGKMMFLGTILHEDTVPRVLQRSDQWFGIERKIIGLEELQSVLDNHCTFTPDGRVEIPEKSKCDQLQKDMTTLAWPERASLYYILSLYKREYDQGNISYFYQEYLSITTPPDEVKFDRSKIAFVSMKIETRLYGRRPMLTWKYEGKDYAMPLEPTAGMDIATSERKKADETVVCCAQHGDAFAYEGNYSEPTKEYAVCILDMIGGKGWAINEEQISTNKKRMGQATTIMRWVDKWLIQKAVIEVNGQQELVLKEIRQQLQRAHPHVHATGEIAGNTEKKADRIVSLLEPFFASPRIKTIFVNAAIRPQFEKFWAQLLNLGNEDHDDWPDALATTLKHAQRIVIHEDPQIQTAELFRRKVRTSYPPRQQRHEEEEVPDWETM